MSALITSPADDGSDRPVALSTRDTLHPLRTGTSAAAGWPVITAAEEILPAGAAETDYDLWCETRRRGLGGSDIAAVLGLNPWHSAYHVWLDKTGRGRPTRDTFIMRRGRYYEPALAQWFSDETGIATRRTGTWARTGEHETWMFVNPDRLTADGKGLELKMPASQWSAQWTVDRPAYYALVQGIWSAYVLGLPGWYLGADVEQGQGPCLPMWYLDVQEWAAQLAYWHEYCEWWWFRYVVADLPPPVDGSEATAEALNWAYRSPVNLGHMVRVPGLRLKVQERARLKEAAKATERELLEVENWIKAALQHDETGCDEDDIPVIAWRPVGVDPEDAGMPKYRAMREIKPPKPKAPRKRAATKVTTP